jgi:hypothetical protein
MNRNKFAKLINENMFRQRRLPKDRTAAYAFPREYMVNAIAEDRNARDIWVGADVAYVCQTDDGTDADVQIATIRAILGKAASDKINLDELRPDLTVELACFKQHSEHMSARRFFPLNASRDASFDNIPYRIPSSSIIARVHLAWISDACLHEINGEDWQFLCDEAARTKALDPPLLRADLRGRTPVRCRVGADSDAPSGSHHEAVLMETDDLIARIHNHRPAGSRHSKRRRHPPEN